MKYLVLIIMTLVINVRLCAEEYFYHITLKSVDDGKSERYYVKCTLPPLDIVKAIEENKMITFNETYAYLISSDKFEKIRVWNDLMTGVMIVRGENIVVLQLLAANPETFESKNRLFKSKQAPKEKSE